MSTDLELVDTLKGHSENVWAVSWSHSGSLLASCGTDKSVRIWNQEGGKYVCKTVLNDGHQRTVRDVAWSLNDKLLASASFDGTTAVWDRKEGQFECALTLEGHENEVKAVAWSPSGQYLATCGRDKRVWIWAIDDDEDYECASVLSSHTQDVKSVLWHPTKDILVSTSYDNTVKLYIEEEDDWECFATLESHNSTVWGAAFNSKGDRLATCSDDCTVKIWQEYPKDNQEGVISVGKYPSWKCVCTLSGFHSRSIYDIKWNHQTGFIATACGDNGLRVFEETQDSDPNAPSFQLIAQQRQAHSEDINKISWNPKQPDTIASCSDDGTIKIWRCTTEV